MTVKDPVFVVGLDEFNQQMLATLPQAAGFDFHPALRLAEMCDHPDADLTDS